MRSKWSPAWLFLAAMALFVVMAAGLVAQDKKPDATASKKEDATISAKHHLSRLSKDVDVTTFTDNVVVKHEDTTLTADRAEYTDNKKKETQTVVLEGNVRIVDPKNTITADKAVAYLNERKTVITGNVKLVTLPATGEKTERTNAAIAKLEEPATVTCDNLEYLYRKKIATFSGNLKVVTGERTFIGQQAVYDLNKELVTITGDAKGYDEQGQKFASSGTMEVSLKEGDEWIKSENVSATIKVDVDKETGGEETPETPPEKK